MGNRRSPRNSSAAELAKFGVAIADPHTFLLECKLCGHRWSPDLPSRMRNGGKFARGYWICPDACNKPE